MTYLVNLLPRERAALPDGREWRGPNALRDIARTLIGEGAAPDANVLALRDGRPVLEGTIAAFAGRQWRGEHRDPDFGKWRPHPRAQMPAPLGRWATENGSLGAGRYRPTGADTEASGEPGEAV